VANNNSYHLFGSLPPNEVSLYNTIQNCWLVNDNEIPKISLFIPSDTLIPIGYSYQPTSCIPDDYSGSQIADQGFGIFDTIKVSNYDSTGILSGDETLLSQAGQSFAEKNYPEAIINYKALIDNFPASSSIYFAQDELYNCYFNLDTSSNQNTTDVLYGDLKQFLETKITSGIYDAEFEDNAARIIFMCATRMEDYDIALTGYEFLAIYHPDAEQRLMASWEYDNIENLLQGMGGGEKDNYELQIKNYEFEEAEIEMRMKRLDELIDRDPITRVLKEKYDRINKEKKALRETKGDALNREMNINEDKIIQRSKENIYLSRTLSEEEKEKRLFEDMKLLFESG